LLLLSALAISIFESADRISRGFRIFSLALQLLPAWLVFAFCQVTPRPFLHQWFSAELVVVIFGTLLLASESNYLVRLLFHVCKLEPKIKARDEIDQDEYRAGRVIGILERNLIFLIVYFSGQFEAVGFMLAAKGLIRIRQLKDRQFSEYLLIGTLASAICSVLVAEALRPYC
ncbi:MAG TPA: hypothetical protein VKZ92_03445, partial [Pseudohongiella sp.]|nr:hypothetical protein [Pseudohongiella sp.]